MTVDDSLGTVYVSNGAIATIASQALLTCYGVVGMASRNAINDLYAQITRDPHHGINVEYRSGKLSIDAYVVMQHGTRIASVAESVIHAIRYNVEKSCGLPVHQVNVYVQGLRLLDDQK
ncbi:MAG: Asp23/Gls24 family envelope stress response protein [Chloroflexi bacterium]|nr:Asp23/Gls24 family envelope stress response protein [Chloroflexota bacterium]